MSIKTDKLQIIEDILKVEDGNLIKRIQHLLDKRHHDPKAKMSFEELQEKINRSEEDVKDGKLYVHEDVVKYFKKKNPK